MAKVIDKININLTGAAFLDELHNSVGSSGFNLDHDWFWGATDLEIWTAAGKIGDRLIESIDYDLSVPNVDLTTRTGKITYNVITVTNATYQTGDLYFNGQYIADANDAEDLNRLNYLSRIIIHNKEDDIIIPSNAELFEYNTPDLVSSKGRQPLENPIFNYLPAKISEQGIADCYDNSWCKWPGRGVIGLFESTTNLVKDPEDLTTANWTNEHSTDALSSFYFNGKKFTKITGDNTDIYARVRQTITFTTNGVKSATCIFKKGNGIKSRLILHNGTISPLTIQIIWSTKTVIATHGTLVKANWYGDDIVEVFGISTTITAADPNKVFISPVALEAGTTTNYAYATAVMVEDSTYPTPYTPTARPAGSLQYPLEMPSKFTMIFWVRPWFTYNTLAWHRFFTWSLDNTHRFLCYYDTTYDRINLVWQDGSTNRAMSSQVFDDGTSHDDINQWIMIAMSIDLTTGTTAGSIFKVYADTNVADTTWTGNIDSKTSTFPTLYIGQEYGGTSPLDGLMTDFLFVPDEVWTEVQLDAHHTANRPYYADNRILGKNCNMRQDEFGNAYFKRLEVLK